MEKHFELPSNDSVKFVMHFEEVREINYEKIELEEKNAISKKIKNEFDENLERSTIIQDAKINYEHFIGKNKPNEDIVLEKTDSNYFQQSWNNDVIFNEEANLFGCNNVMVDVY